MFGNKNKKFLLSSNKISQSCSSNGLQHNLFFWNAHSVFCFNAKLGPRVITGEDTHFDYNGDAY